jgi:hypothetical protein
VHSVLVRCSRRHHLTFGFSLLLLQLLQVVLWLSSTVLFIPVCTTLLRVFECDGDVWLQSSLTCDSLALRLLRVIGSFCAIAYIAIAVCSKNPLM